MKRCGRKLARINSKTIKHYKPQQEGTEQKRKTISEQAFSPSLSVVVLCTPQIHLSLHDTEICISLLLAELFCLMYLRPPAQRLSKAVVEILEFQLTASGRGQVSVTGTDCTSSVCLPSSWWGRRTSPVRRTTSGQLRNPAAFVSYWTTPLRFDVHLAHTCMNQTLLAGTSTGRAA